MPIVKLAATTRGDKLANYLQRDNFGEDRAVFVSEGINGIEREINSAQKAEKDFKEVREHFGKTDGVQAHMAYVSFKRDDLGDLAKPDGTPDWDKIEKWSHEFARRAGIADRHQYYVVAHDDKPHPHLHVVWNSVSDHDGKKYHSPKNVNIERMRDVADGLAREHGIKSLPARERNDEKVHDKVLRAAERGAPAYSWKRDLQYRIRDAATRAKNWEDFKERLQRNGVEVRERGSGVSYSFNDSLEKKRIARASRLGEAYQREDIERRFETNRLRQESLPKTKEERLQRGKDLSREKENFKSWKQELRAAFRYAEKNAHSPEEFHRLAASRGLEVKRSDEGIYRFQFSDRYGNTHEATADTLRKGSTDAGIERRISETINNPVKEAPKQQEATQAVSSRRIGNMAARGAEGISKPLTDEINRNSHPQAGVPVAANDMDRERRRRRTSTGNEDGLRSNESPDRGRGF